VHAVFEGLDTLTSQFADALSHLGTIFGLVPDVNQQVPKRGHLGVDFGHQLQQTKNKINYLTFPNFCSKLQAKE